MLNDVNFQSDGDREIRMTIDHGGSRLSYRVPEQMAIKVLRQLGEIFANRSQKDNREAAGHVVETPPQGDSGESPLPEETPPALGGS